ncbi:inosine/xanthosine triphosphatase [Rufibacter latericius]|uniref:Probable inosine/xanthosine triphosphatase n=1 Tax=Rufibacter latericius TaxID=2487040 RepID=A0A3M9MU20_9BACT|nr:inosine/xanthosine triphosphatase [Rufibacter latericius]RNI28677.1 non-canonical purine NTP phosphatase [Rufibacter latericius]
MNKVVQKVVVASTNPVKLKAVQSGLQAMFPEQEFTVEAISVPSEVADQPMSDTETLTGAFNRVCNALDAYPQADYWVGIEGGVQMLHDELAAFAWIVVRTPRLVGKARSGMFFLPKAVAELVQQGVELGEADDRVFGHSNSKQNGGAIGLLTDNVVDRKQLYEQAVKLALVPFKNESLYLRD